jgi:hypothetical protein
VSADVSIDTVVYSDMNAAVGAAVSSVVNAAVNPTNDLAAVSPVRDVIVRSVMDIDAILFQSESRSTS